VDFLAPRFPRQDGVPAGHVELGGTRTPAPLLAKPGQSVSRTLGPAQRLVGCLFHLRLASAFPDLRASQEVPPRNRGERKKTEPRARTNNEQPLEDRLPASGSLMPRRHQVTTMSRADPLEQSVTSGVSLRAVHVGPQNRKVGRPCSSQRGDFDPLLAGPGLWLTNSSVPLPGSRVRGSRWL